MSHEVVVLEKGSEEMREEIADTRAALVGKLETLEHGIMATVHDATAAVTDTVENVKATVKGVQGAVSNSVAAVGRALDLRAHLRQHPWMWVTGAVLLGLLVGRLRR
jgi:ElaB/YqjD/DUF883 family membrane-anchored ribosome-binding protein